MKHSYSFYLFCLFINYLIGHKNLFMSVKDWRKIFEMMTWA